MEKEPEVSAGTRDTENTSPGYQGFSLRGEVSTCWCVSGVTSESQSGFTQSLPLGGKEWLGVMSSSQDPKKWPSLVWSLGLCLRPLLLMVSGPGGGCGKHMFV